MLVYSFFTYAKFTELRFFYFVRLVLQNQEDEKNSSEFSLVSGAPLTPNIRRKKRWVWLNKFSEGKMKDFTGFLRQSEAEY